MQNCLASDWSVYIYLAGHMISLYLPCGSHDAWGSFLYFVYIPYTNVYYVKLLTQVVVRHSLNRRPDED